MNQDKTPIEDYLIALVAAVASILILTGVI